MWIRWKHIRTVTAVVALFFAAGPVNAVWVVVSLKERVRRADLIVIGELKNVIVDRLSITYHKYFMTPIEIEGRGERDYELFYNVGEIMPEQVLKGEATEPISFASYSRAEVNGREAIFFDLNNFHFPEGTKGIWILKKDAMIQGYYGTTYPNSCLPLDSLTAMQRYLED